MECYKIFPAVAIPFPELKSRASLPRRKATFTFFFATSLFSCGCFLCSAS